MPIFVSDYHFLNNFLDVFIGGFHDTIHLHPALYGIRMLDFSFGTELHYHLAVKILCIIDHYLFGGPYRQIKCIKSDF
jgi:hypothetical protein